MAPNEVAARLPKTGTNSEHRSMNAPTVNIANLRVACSSCNLRELCLPVGLSLKEIEKLEELVATRKKVKRGDSLFRAGDKFESLYAVRLGFLKSTVMSQD